MAKTDWLSADGVLIAGQDLTNVALTIGGVASTFGAALGAGVAGAAQTITGTGTRGAQYILNNSAPPASAGQTLGQQIWIGGNPTGTPGIGDCVGQTIIVTNEAGRSNIWGADIAVLQDPSGTDGQIRALELEVAATKSFNADPFSSSPRSNNLELIGHGGSTFRPTSALCVWSNDTTGSKWHYSGAVISRVYDTGLKFVQNPGGATDAVNAFQTAAISDLSNSARVLNVGGSHSIIMDLSTATAIGTFVKTTGAADANLGMSNFADHALTLSLSSGNTAGQQTKLALQHNNADKWWVFKDAAHGLGVFNVNTGTTVLSIATGSNVVTLPTGAAVAGGLTVSGNTGFFGAAAVARPILTYSRATETAGVTAIRLALASLGLVLDSTVA